MAQTPIGNVHDHQLIEKGMEDWRSLCLKVGNRGEGKNQTFVSHNALGLFSIFFVCQIERSGRGSKQARDSWGNVGWIEKEGQMDFEG